MGFRTVRSRPARPVYQAPSPPPGAARGTFSQMQGSVEVEVPGPEKHDVRAHAAPPARASRRGEWMLLAALAAVQFCHIVDFVLVMPLGPQLMRSFAINPQQFALIVSVYTFSAAVSGLLAAFFMDRYDRKHALVFLLVGFALGTLLCAWAPTYGFLLAARVAAGAFGGVLASVVFAIVGDQIPPERRGLAMGIVMSGFSAASILGLPLGLWVAAHAGWHMPFAVLAAVTGGVALYAALALPSMRQHLGGERPSPLAGVLDVVRQPMHRRAFLLMVLMMFGGFTLTPFLSPYLVANVGVAEADLTYVYLFGGIFTLAVGPIVGRLADRFGQNRVFMGAALLSIVPLLLVTNLPRVPLWAALAVTSFMMVGFNARMVPGMALVTGSVEPRRRGAFMSVNSSVQQMAAGLASFAGGAIVGGSEATGLTRFPLVGLLAVGSTLLAIPVARGLRAARGDVGGALASSPSSEPARAPGRAASH